MKSELVLLLLLSPLLSFSQPIAPKNYTAFSHTIYFLNMRVGNFIPEGREVLSGQYGGYAIYYGPGGRYSTDIIPVTAKITKKDNAFEMQWQGRKEKPSLLKFYAVADMLKFDTSAQYILHSTTDGILRYPMATTPKVRKEMDLRLVNDSVYIIGNLGERQPDGPLCVILGRVMEKNREDIPDTVSMRMSQTWVFDFADVDITLKQTTTIQLTLYSPEGKLLKQTSLSKLPAGNFAAGFNLIGAPSGDYRIDATAIGDQTRTTVLKFHKD